MDTFATRRRFLQATVAAVGGTLEAAALLPERASACAPRSPGLSLTVCQENCLQHVVDMATELGLEGIELRLGEGIMATSSGPWGIFGFRRLGIEPLERRHVLQLKRIAADAGVRFVSLYAESLMPKQGVEVEMKEIESHCRGVFELSQSLEINLVVAEPIPEAFDMLERLCGEYRISLAIRNRVRPYRGWKAQLLAKSLENRAKWMGACADLANWDDSGLNPVEQVEALKGRLHCLCFKPPVDLGSTGSIKRPRLSSTCTTTAIHRAYDGYFLVAGSLDQAVPNTVLDDGASDVLTGSAGLDWFFFNQREDRDRATDLKDEVFANDLEWILGA